MEKFDSDWTRSQKDADIVLDLDDPEKRKTARKFLVRMGQEDLADMLGINQPIPRYGFKP